MSEVQPNLNVMSTRAKEGYKLKLFGAGIVSMTLLLITLNGIFSFIDGLFPGFFKWVLDRLHGVFRFFLSQRI